MQTLTLTKNTLIGSAFAMVTHWYVLLLDFNALLPKIISQMCLREDGKTLSKNRDSMNLLRAINVKLEFLVYTNLQYILFYLSLFHQQS